MTRATDHGTAKRGATEIRAALAESRRLFAAIGLFSAFVNLLMLTGPLFMLQIYDRVLTSRSEATLAALAAIVAFLFLMMGLLDHARARVLARVGARFQARLDGRVLGAILTRAGRSAKARSMPATGLADLEAMQRFASGPGPFAFFDAPWTPVFLFVLFTFHWMLGVLAVLSGVLLLALAPIDQAVAQWPLLQHTLAARRSLTSLLSETPEEPARTPLPKPRARLEADNLVVVTLGGAALDQYGEDVLARHVGWLPQEVVLFDGPVAENIARLDPEPDTDAVIRAAEQAGAHEMIVDLPGGYDFQVAAGGAALSGGQRQRIALARAFYGEPVVVLLDEPDAHLDAAGAEALNRAVAGLKARGGAVVMVAHRTGAFAECDTVHLMEGGRNRPADMKKARPAAQGAGAPVEVRALPGPPPVRVQRPPEGGANPPSGPVRIIKPTPPSGGVKPPDGDQA